MGMDPVINQSAFQPVHVRVVFWESWIWFSQVVSKSSKHLLQMLGKNSGFTLSSIYIYIYYIK